MATSKRKTASAFNAEEPLKNWANLNDALRDCTESQAQVLLDAERAGKRRFQYLHRIHSRLNKARADRERRELLGEA